MWLFFILVAVPIIEIALFIQVGGWIGLWPTIAIVIATALLGTLLLRQQGFAALNDLQSRLEEGRDPLGALAHGAMILIAGIVLLTPGFFTDIIGFLLLIPPVRSLVIRFAGDRIKLKGAAWTVHGADEETRRAADATIDGDYKDVTPPEEGTTPGNSGWTQSPEVKAPRR